MNKTVEKPKKRTELRLWAGRQYHSLMRKILWLRLKGRFAKQNNSEYTEYCYFSHRTPLLRKLKDVDMWMQKNKIVNLKIAARKIDGVLIRPGEIFSYWKLIGKPSKRKGYLPGMILKNGHFESGTGGGLCQMSNLIFWMTVHTPLTVIERHRHGYDVFPDSGRTQPFGSGATCFYPYGDLMIRNDTSDIYRLKINVGKEYLEGEWRVSSPPRFRFEIEERNHQMRCEYWGGYTRHNELYRLKYNLDGELLEERSLVKNSAIMMYSPFLDDKKQ
ncbi:MAG: vancomycin resistance protein [Ruminococcaceae bacterium]|nr:vancomycin resistance protein [Oscillospiraceae bacterium]